MLLSHSFYFSHFCYIITSYLFHHFQNVISIHTVSGTYHTATINRHTRTETSMIIDRIKFSANSAISLFRELFFGMLQRHSR